MPSSAHSRGGGMSYKKNQGVPWGTPWFFYAYSAVITAFSPSDVAWMAEMGWR